MHKEDFIFFGYIIIICLILYTLSSIWQIAGALNKIVELEQQRIKIEQQTQDKLQAVESSINLLTLWIKNKR